MIVELVIALYFEINWFFIQYFHNIAFMLFAMTVYIIEKLDDVIMMTSHVEIQRRYDRWKRYIVPIKLLKDFYYQQTKSQWKNPLHYRQQEQQEQCQNYGNKTETWL